MQDIKVEIVKEMGEIFYKVEISGDKFLFEKKQDLIRFGKQNNIRLIF